MTGSRLFAVPLLLVLTVTISGCWDRKELEERTSVVAMAFDKEKEQKGGIRITVQIPIPQKIAGGGAGQAGQGGKNAVQIMTSSGPTVTEALNNIQKRLNQELFYGHTRILAISEDLARDGIDSIIDILRRTPQIRRLLWPLVVKGEARQLLEANLELEQIPIMYLMDMMINSSKLGVMPDITLGTLFNNLSDTTREPDMNIIEAAPEGIRWNGVAVFKESKMVGQLNSDEVSIMLQIRDEKTGGPIAAYCDREKKKRVVMRPKTIKTKRYYSFRNGNALVTVKVRLEGDIVESQCNIKFSEQKNLRKTAENLKLELEARAKKLFKRSQLNLKQDLFSLQTEIRAKHPDWWKKMKWKDEFQEMDLNAIYEIHIRRTGMEMRQ
jgi:spore germination protein KC